MISISRRKQVAQIKGSPIYVITGVSLIPLSSRKEAESAIQQAKRSLQEDASEQGSDVPDSDISEDESHDTHGTLSEDDHQDSPVDVKSPPSSETAANKSSVAEDVIGRKGQYGRFAERWFSRKGWGTERRRTQGMSAEKPTKGNSDTTVAASTKTADEDYPNSDGASVNAKVSPSTMAQKAPDEAKRELSTQSSTDNVTNTLHPKLLQTTKMILASRSFFFSYDYDITRRMGNQGAKNRDVPLHRTVDPLVCLLATSLPSQAEVYSYCSSFGTTI